MFLSFFLIQYLPNNFAKAIQNSFYLKSQLNLSCPDLVFYLNRKHSRYYHKENLKNDLLNLDPKTDVMINLLTIEQLAQMKSDLERTDELLADLSEMRVELVDTIKKVEIFYKKLLTSD